MILYKTPTKVSLNIMILHDLILKKTQIDNQNLFRQAKVKKKKRVKLSSNSLIFRCFWLRFRMGLRSALPLSSSVATERTNDP